jgi:large subunit ribosomal protein L21
MAKDFAIIQTGGKQYKISSGENLKIERLPVQEGGVVVFDKVLLRSTGDRVEIGTPYLAGVTVEAKFVEDGRGEKKIIFKYHSKTRQRKKKGHRQGYTEVQIV